MSFSKWFLKINSSELIGDVKTASQVENPKQHPFWFVFYLILGQILFWYIIYWANSNVEIQKDTNWYLYFALYLFLSMFLRPQPDYKNLGFLGGLIGNPFTITDDINQLLLVFKLILLPGKIMTNSFFYLIQSIAHLTLLLLK